jgi:dihydroorotase
VGELNGLQDYDLLVSGGRVVTESGVRAADIAVRNGRIAMLLEPGTGVRAARTLDAAGKYVLPGLIDSHVHFRTPGLTSKEDWAHASRAAVAGGITTVIDMPNTVPPTFTSGDMHDKHSMVSGNSLVDYQFHAGIDPHQVDRLESFRGREVSSAKAFLTGHHTAPHVLRDDNTLDRLFEMAARHDIRLLFHAEDDAVFALLDAWQGDPKRYADYERHRPRTGGIVAVAKLIELARRYGTAVHVLHVSSKEEADLLSAARASGLPVTFEVTAHHLSFTSADTRRLGARIRLSPAIREEADQDRLWQAVIDGHARCVGSDHAPHQLQDKTLAPDKAPPGLPGVQELLPALFTGLRRRLPDEHEASLLRIVSRVLAEGPAQTFQLGHRKGCVSAGFDADLVIFDPTVNWMLSESEIHAKCGWSAYQGWTFTGVVETTIRRGELVYQRHDGGRTSFGVADGAWLSAADVGTSQPVSTVGGAD